MKMRRHGLRWALLMIPVATVGFLASGCHSRHSSMEKRSEWVTKIISSELDLTTVQEKKLEALRQEFIKSRKAMKTTREAQFGEVIALVRAEKMDQAKVLDLARHHLLEMTQRVDQQGPKWAEMLADLHGSLTPEQKNLAVKKLEKMKRFFEEDSD